MTELEKDELFAEFLVRMAELDKDDKKLSSAKNRKALTGVSEYYNKVCNYHQDWMRDDLGLFKFFGIYHAYEQIRRAIPMLVNAKLRGDVRHEQKPTKPLEEWDRDEATKAGKYLIDAMIAYLREGEDKDE